MRNTRLKSSLARRNVTKFLENRLAIFGLFLLLLLISVSVFAPFLSPYDPILSKPSDRFLSPSVEHWLGTDRLGRDLLTRILYGGRISILIGLASALSAQFIGVVLGCLSGYYGKKIDAVILYITEIFACFPSIILVLVLVGFVGQGVGIIIIVFALTGWTGSMRMVRAKILSLKEEPFIESCVANGLSGFSIMFRHLLPNTLGIVIVNITMATSLYVLEETGLSFLGMGVPLSIPTWGTLLNSAKSLSIMSSYPLSWIGPGVAISLFVLGSNFFGDGLRDVFDTTQ
jgi:peptide/nickel transport system permease protein